MGSVEVWIGDSFELRVDELRVDSGCVRGREVVLVLALAVLGPVEFCTGNLADRPVGNWNNGSSMLDGCELAPSDTYGSLQLLLHGAICKT